MTDHPRRIKRWLTGHVGGVLFLGAGTLVGQVVVLATTPILSRLYTPEAFGIFSALLALASVVGAGASLKLELAILIPEKDEEASSILRIAAFSSIASAFIGGLIVFLLQLGGANLVNPHLGLAPIWVASFIIFPAFITLSVQVALREKRYGAIGRRTFAQSIAGSFGQLLLGLFAPGPSSLLGGALIGNVVGLFSTAKMSLQLLLMKPPTKWYITLKKYWKFPALFLPAAFLNAFGSQIPIMAVIAYFGLSAGGEFAMTQRILAIPASIIGLSISQVYAAEFALHVRSGGEGGSKIYLKSSGVLSLIAIPTGIAVSVVGIWLLPVFLGNQWSLAGQLTLPLSVTLALSLVVNPTSQVFALFQSPLALVLDAGRVALLAVAVGIQALVNLPVLEFVWLICFSQAIHYVATWILGYRVSSGHPNKVP